jgi:hypothetical protein
MRLLVISLLTILAGTLLLAKFRKEAAGKFFSFISWFFIVTGFVLFIGVLGFGTWRVSHCGYECRPGWRHEMMMKDWKGPMHNRWCPPGRCWAPGDSIRKKCCPNPKRWAADSVNMQEEKK